MILDGLGVVLRAVSNVTGLTVLIRLYLKKCMSSSVQNELKKYANGLVLTKHDTLIQTTAFMEDDVFYYIVEEDDLNYKTA